jgi:hypothetical protein
VCGAGSVNGQGEVSAPRSIVPCRRTHLDDRGCVRLQGTLERGPQLRGIFGAQRQGAEAFGEFTEIGIHEVGAEDP